MKAAVSYRGIIFVLLKKKEFKFNLIMININKTELINLKSGLLLNKEKLAFNLRYHLYPF